MNFRNMEEFWPFYTNRHSKAATRRWHFIGTLLSILCLIYAVLFNWWLLFCVPVFGYGCAWYSYFYVEGNIPATFGHPVWSLLCDYKMFGFMIAGQMDREIKRLDPRLTAAIVPYANSVPFAITNHARSEEYLAELYHRGDMVAMGYSMLNSSGQAVSVTTNNAPVLGEPPVPLPDIVGFDEGVAFEESVETTETYTSTNDAGIMSAVCKKMKSVRSEVSGYGAQYYYGGEPNFGAANGNDVGQYLNLGVYSGGGVDAASYGGSTYMGNTNSYNEVNRDRLEIEQLKGMVEDLKRERYMLVRKCTELRGKVEDREREFLSYTDEFDRVLAERQNLRAEVEALGREIDRLRRRSDRRR